MGPKIQHKETKSERREIRKQVGKLQNQVVSSDTRSRYAESFAAFCRFAGMNLQQLAADITKIDPVLSSYIEFMWEDGEPKSYANYAVASVQFHLPAARRHLPFSWKLVATWNKLEMPARVTPLSPSMAMSFAGLMYQWGYPSAGHMIIVAFSCFLRTGEMFQVRRQDVVLPKTKHQGAIIFLKDTKGGQRKQIQWEKVTVYEKVALDCLSALCKAKKGGEALLDLSIYRFRSVWKEAVKELKLEHLKVQPYSIRRGGATSAYRQGMSFEELVSRGRWAHITTARIYLDEGLQELAAIQLPDGARASLHRSYQAFIRRKPGGDAWKGG